MGNKRTEEDKNRDCKNEGLRLTVNMQTAKNKYPKNRAHMKETTLKETDKEQIHFQGTTGSKPTETRSQMGKIQT